MSSEGTRSGASSRLAADGCGENVLDEVDVGSAQADRCLSL